MRGGRRFQGFPAFRRQLRHRNAVLFKGDAQLRAQAFTESGVFIRCGTADAVVHVAGEQGAAAALQGQQERHRITPAAQARHHRAPVQVRQALRQQGSSAAACMAGYFLFFFLPLAPFLPAGAFASARAISGATAAKRSSGFMSSSAGTAFTRPLA